jgi:hypothetical protein
VPSHGVFMNHVCRVIKFYPLQGVLLIRISATLLNMGDDLIAVFKCSNATSLCCYVNYEDDIDYFIVKA